MSTDREIAEAATPGPWATESCGEKGDGSEMIGIVFGPDDEKCESPLSGDLPAVDASGEFIEYYRDELVAECAHRNRNSHADARFIAHFSPAHILKIIAVVEAVEACLEVYSGSQFLSKLDALESALADLKKVKP